MAALSRNWIKRDETKRRERDRSTSSCHRRSVPPTPTSTTDDGRGALALAGRTAEQPPMQLDRPLLSSSLPPSCTQRCCSSEGPNAAARTASVALGGENFPHRMAEGEQEREWGTGGESDASARALTDQRTELRVKQLQYFGVSTFSKRNVHLGFRVTLFQSALVLRYVITIILSLSTTVTLSFE